MANISRRVEKLENRISERNNIIIGVRSDETEEQALHRRFGVEGPPKGAKLHFIFRVWI